MFEIWIMLHDGINWLQTIWNEQKFKQLSFLQIQLLNENKSEFYGKIYLKNELQLILLIGHLGEIVKQI